MKKNIRLPKYIRPERYKIMVKPDLEGFVFFGEETIYLALKKSVKEITLHAKELEIFEVRYHVSGITYQVKIIKFHPKTETVIFDFKKNLPKGKGELSLKFKGVLNDKMRGFYRSRYIYRNKEKHLATTQFEATDARKAFPCFDEPHQKAVFDITLMIPPGTMAISNTIATSISEHESGYKIVQFAPTPKMSTYLVAFIVGDFEYLEGTSKRGVLTRVFVTPGKKHQAKFALSCAIQILDFYEKYFDIPYPLPVLDLIAIPDFDHGAMENWGAITFRESALLADEKNTSASNKQWIATVIAHELAHQWFGNLVTMKWWTHLWLNEGFASYIENLAVDHLFPRWNIWEQFVHGRLGTALKLDSLANTHPIEIPVHHPREIDEIFDEVSYDKGAAVIRMLASYLGETDFQGGLRLYLKKHSFDNASTTDLWQAFARASKKNVPAIMKNWTSKPGYPVIRIIEQKKNLHLVQSRFYSSRLSRKQNADKTLWQIPIKYHSNIQTSKHLSILLNRKSVLIKKSKAAKWIKINANENGFFRTDYPAQILNTFISPIKEKQLKPVDRLGVIRDAFALAESGQLPTIQALELAKAFLNEHDYIVWIDIISHLMKIDNLIHKEEFYNLYRKYCREILKTVTKYVGWTGDKQESHTTKLLRSLVLYHAGYFGDSEVIKRAKKIFNSGKVPPDLRGMVYQLIAANGNQPLFQKLQKMYIAEAMQEEKNRVGRALGQFKQKKILQKTLNFSLSKNVRSQDTAGIIVPVWSNHSGRDLAWTFVKKHWGWFAKRYGEGSHLLQRIIQSASQFTSEKEARDVIKFFKTHKTLSVQRTVQQAVEKIRSNDAWLKSERSHIENWLKKN